MAISEVGSGYCISSNTAAGTISATHGLSIQAGDIVTALVSINETADFQSTLSDNNGSYPFTTLYEYAESDGNTLITRYCYRVAGSSEPATYSWTINGTNQYGVIHIRVFRGCDTSSPWDVAPSEGMHVYGSNSPETSASLTTTTNGALAIAWCSGDGNNSLFALVTANGYGNELEYGSYYNAASYTRACPTAGVIGTMEVSLSPDNDIEIMVGALKPAPTGVVTSGLVAEYVGKLANGGVSQGTNSPAVSTWDDLKGSLDLAVTGAAYTESDGWAGTGAAGSPYRFVLDGGTHIYKTTTAVRDESLTVEAWVKPSSSTMASTAPILQNRGYASDGWQLAQNATTQYAFRFSWYNGSTWQLGNDVTLSNAWYHVVAVKDGTSVQMYLNGSASGAPAVGSGTISFAADDLLDIGRLAVNSSYFIGEIAAVRYYSRALSAAEVAQNYAAGILANSIERDANVSTGVTRSGLVAEYAGRYAKNGTLPGNNTDPTSTWKDLAGGNDLSSTGFAWDSNSGWVGTGGVVAPYAIQCDGTDSYFYVSNGIIDADAAWSAEVWCFVPTTLASNRTVWCTYPTSNENATIVITIYSSTGIATLYWFNDAYTPYEVTGGADLRNGRHHLVATFGSGTARLYVDGSSVGTPATPAGTTTNNTVLVGAHSSGTSPKDNFWPGNIATARLYSRALSAAEVAQNYAAGVNATALQQNTALLYAGIA